MQLQSSTEPRQRKKNEKIEKMPLHHRHSTIYFCIQVAKNLHATQCAVIHVFWVEMREDIYTNWCNWIRSTSRTSGECSSGRVRLVCVSLPSFALCLSLCVWEPRSFFLCPEIWDSFNPNRTDQSSSCPLSVNTSGWTSLYYHPLHVTLSCWF